MDDKCKVSILCAAFNHGKYIRQTIEGFLAQETSFKYEILINDDASCDDTAEIIRSYEKEYPDVVFPVYQTENQYSKGVVILDVLLERARGKYVAICEGDDYWTDSRKLQIQYDWLERYPEYSACVHNSTILNCDSNKETLYNITYADDCDLVLEDVVYGIGKVYHTSSILTRMDLFSRMPEFYYASMRHHVGDHPMAIWFAIKGKIRYINRVMSVYRSFSAPTSWTVCMRDIGFVEDRLNGAIEMYKLVQGNVSGSDAKTVNKAILKYEWELLQARGEYAKMKKAPYESLYKAAPIKQRLWISFKQYFPGMYCTYMKLRGRDELIPDAMRRR